MPLAIQFTYFSLTWEGGGEAEEEGEMRDLSHSLVHCERLQQAEV